MDWKKAPPSGSIVVWVDQFEEYNISLETSSMVRLDMSIEVRGLDEKVRNVDMHELSGDWYRFR